MSSTTTISHQLNRTINKKVVTPHPYAFNGMEKDDEIAGEGNSYTAEFWQYDSRVARRWNVDPVVKEHESPYAAFANNPIWFIDPEGNTIVDPKTGKPVVKVNGEWKSIEKVAKDGTITYGTVSDKFNEQTKPYLDILEKSEVGKDNIEYMQAIPTLITIDPSLEDPLPGDASTVEPTGELRKDGYYESVNIIPDNGVINQNADEAKINVEEKTSGVLAVEVGHLKPEQIVIDQGDGSFAERYNGLLNDHIRAQISYRNDNGIALDESLFTPLDKFKDAGFKLDTDLQEIRDNLP